MRILLVGDTHGNTLWLRRYIYPVALTVEAQAVVVLGDFGAWEHTAAGVAFMDECNDLATDAQIPLYWVRGNHDKVSHTLANYKKDKRYFYVCREHVFHIPDGLHWRWGGVSFRAFGGAYSVDKAWRVQTEQEKYLAALRRTQQAFLSTGEHTVVEPQTGTLWFPEEEMTDADMSSYLDAYSGPVDVILSHDKPYSAKPGWNRKDLPGCIPNQLRLERALRAHKPQWWFHGHLHHAYTDHVYGEDFATTVLGLEPDEDAAEIGWKASHTWAVLDADDGDLEVRRGSEKFVDRELLAKNWQRLND